MLYTGEYTTIDWPESQKYMDENWFPTEAIATAQSGTYLIPNYRIPDR